MDEGIEAQRGEGTCPSLPSQHVAQLGFGVQSHAVISGPRVCRTRSWALGTRGRRVWLEQTRAPSELAALLPCLSVQIPGNRGGGGGCLLVGGCRHVGGASCRPHMVALPTLWCREGLSGEGGGGGSSWCTSATLGSRFVSVSFQPRRVGGRARGPRALCAVFILMATLIPLVRMRLRELQSPVPGHTASQRQRWDEPPLGCPGLCPTPAWGTASLNQDSLPSGALGRSCWLVGDVGASFTLSLLICYIQVQRLHQGLPQRAAGCCRLPENL